MIGLTGTQGTGKTTLAEALSNQRSSCAFLKTGTSDVFKSLGRDPRMAMTLEERLYVQWKILEALYEQWAISRQMAHGEIITDRTPLCMAAYTLAEVSGYGEIKPDVDREIVEYVRNCQDIAAELFSAIALVPIGIPFVEDAEKIRATGSRAYREHHQLLIKGLMWAGIGRVRLREVRDLELASRVQQLGDLFDAVSPLQLSAILTK